MICRALLRICRALLRICRAHLGIDSLFSHVPPTNKCSVCLFWRMYRALLRTHEALSILPLDWQPNSIVSWLAVELNCLLIGSRAQLCLDRFPQIISDQSPVRWQGAVHKERWGAGVETQKNVRGVFGGWGRLPFNETYAPSLSTIYDGA